MKHYVQLDGSGECLGVISLVDPPDFPGFVYLEVDNDFDAEGHYHNGTAFITKPAKPSDVHTWDTVNKVWVDARVLEDIKLARLAQINLWRGEANSTSFTYLGKQIACDRLSRSDIDAVSSEMSLTGGFPVGWPGGWKCMDNTYVVITDKPTWVAFLQAMTSQGTANFLKSQTLKAQVAAASTIVDVEAVVWS